MSIKPIETVYNGYRFRSRLEARWAVFFDTLGIRYEYEKDGFDLHGTWYLPDFWLSEHQYWIEIKGKKPTDEELAKVRMLYEVTGYPSCLFYGLPGDHEGYAFYSDVNESGGGVGAPIDDLEWVICRACGGIQNVALWPS